MILTTKTFDCVYVCVCVCKYVFPVACSSGTGRVPGEAVPE